MTSKEEFRCALDEAYEKDYTQNPDFHINKLSIIDVYENYISKLENIIEGTRALKRDAERTAVQYKIQLEKAEEINYKQGWQAGYAEGFNDAHK